MERSRGASPSWRPDRSTFFLSGVSLIVNLREFHVLAQFLKMLDGIFKMSGSWRPDRSTFFLPGVSQSVNLRGFHVLTQFLKMLDGIYKMSGGHFKMSSGQGGGLWEGSFRRCVRACVRACVPKLPPRPFHIFPARGLPGCKFERVPRFDPILKNVGWYF